MKNKFEGLNKVPNKIPYGSLGALSHQTLLRYAITNYFPHLENEFEILCRLDQEIFDCSVNLNRLYDYIEDEAPIIRTLSEKIESAISIIKLAKEVKNLMEHSLNSLSIEMKELSKKFISDLMNDFDRVVQYREQAIEFLESQNTEEATLALLLE